MNWIGGARNRVKFQGDRRLQKEFFERKKLELKHEQLQKPAHHKRRKKTISQDLVALQIVNRAACAKVGSSPRGGPNVQHIDLNHRRPGLSGRRVELPTVPLGSGACPALSRRPEQVKLPFSPDHHPSRLHLIESQTLSFSNTSIVKSTSAGHIENHVGDEDVISPFVHNNKTKSSIHRNFERGCRLSSQPSPPMVLLTHDERQQSAQPSHDTPLSSKSQQYFNSDSLLDLGLLPPTSYHSACTSQCVTKAHLENSQASQPLVSQSNARITKNLWSSPVKPCKDHTSTCKLSHGQIHDSHYVPQAYNRLSNPCSPLVNFPKSQCRTANSQSRDTYKLSGRRPNSYVSVSQADLRPNKSEVRNHFSVCTQKPQIQRLHKDHLLRKNIWLCNDDEEPSKSRVDMIDPNANLDKWPNPLPAVSLVQHATCLQSDISSHALENNNCRILVEGKSQKRHVLHPLPLSEFPVQGCSKATSSNTKKLEVVDFQSTPESVNLVKQPSSNGPVNLHETFSSACKHNLQSRYFTQEEGQSRHNDLWLPEDFQPSPASSFCSRRQQNDQNAPFHLSSFSAGFHRPSISKWNCYLRHTDENQISPTRSQFHHLSHILSPSLRMENGLEDKMTTSSNCYSSRAIDRNLSSPFTRSKSDLETLQDAQFDVAKEGSVLGDSRILSLVNPFSAAQPILSQQSRTSHAESFHTNCMESVHSLKRPCLDSQGHLEPKDNSMQWFNSGYEEEEKEHRMTSTTHIALNGSTGSGMAPKLQLWSKKQDQGEEALRELEELETQTEDIGHHGDAGSINQDSFLQPSSTEQCPAHCNQPRTNNTAETSMCCDPGHVTDDRKHQHDHEHNVGHAVEKCSPAVTRPSHGSVCKMNDTMFQEHFDPPTDEATDATCSRKRTFPRDETIPQDSWQRISCASARKTDPVSEDRKYICNSLTDGQSEQLQNRQPRNDDHAITSASLRDEPFRTAKTSQAGSEHSSRLSSEKKPYSEASTPVPMDSSQGRVQPARIATAVSAMVQTEWSITAHEGEWWSGKDVMDKGVQWETPPSSQIPATPEAQNSSSSLSQRRGDGTTTPSPLTQHEEHRLEVIQSPTLLLPTSQGSNLMSFLKDKAASLSVLAQQNETGMSTSDSGQHRALSLPPSPQPTLSEQHETLHIESTLSEQHATLQLASMLSEQQEALQSASTLSEQHKTLQKASALSEQRDTLQHESTLCAQHETMQNASTLSEQHDTLQNASTCRHISRTLRCSSARQRDMTISPSGRVKTIPCSASCAQHEMTSVMSPSERHSTASYCSPSSSKTAVIASSSPHDLVTLRPTPSQHSESMSNSSSSGQHRSASSSCQQHEIPSSCSPSRQSMTTLRTSSHDKSHGKIALITSPSYHKSTPRLSSSQSHEETSNLTLSQHHTPPSSASWVPSSQEHSVLTTPSHRQRKTITTRPLSHHQQNETFVSAPAQRLKPVPRTAASQQSKVTPESQASQQTVEVSNSLSTQHNVVSVRLSPSQQQNMVSARLSSSQRCLESAVDTDPRESRRNSDTLNTFKLFETREEALNPTALQKDNEFNVDSSSGNSGQHHQQRKTTSHPRETITQPLSHKSHVRCNTETLASYTGSKSPPSDDIHPAQQNNHF